LRFSSSAKARYRSGVGRNSGAYSNGMHCRPGVWRDALRASARPIFDWKWTLEYHCVNRHLRESGVQGKRWNLAALDFRFRGNDARTSISIKGVGG
jgi:hypothetical protein